MEHREGPTMTTLFPHVHVLNVLSDDHPGIVASVGGLFGSATVIEVRGRGASDAFVHFGGRIPVPIQSLGN
jgi:uncharacterized protein (UPF0210 family)